MHAKVVLIYQVCAFVVCEFLLKIMVFETLYSPSELFSQNHGDYTH
jgi:hypothetical protein